MQTSIIGFFSYIIVTFAWGFVWNLVLFKDKYQEMAATALRAEPIIPLGFIAIITQALTMVLLFKTIFPLAPNLKTAFIITVGVGVFLIVYAAFVVPAKFNVVQYIDYIFMELAFGFIHVSIVGTIFWFIFRNESSQ